ncbi:iron-sulfur cluster assembly scaffold protein [Candidatus Pelagibacter sp.]|nr:iron-sulfur cluster assembly scaffold protein [Candidatus Pelagibacter sp.]
MNLEIINIAANTKNNKDIKNHTHFIKLKNSICGDEIQIKLIIKGEKITNIGYQTDSCIYCQASASLLSKISINSKKDKIIKLCNEAKLFFDKNEENLNKNLKLFSKLFVKKNLSRKDCILLPFKAMKKIVSN